MSLEKKSLLDNRYHLLATSSIYTYDDENLTSYADFLRSVSDFCEFLFCLRVALIFGDYRKFGRYVGKDGFVDTEESIHRAGVKQKQIDRQRNANDDSKQTKSANSLSFDFGSVSIAQKEAERNKKFDKDIKVIEDQMIQSKQMERAFKRQDGDVKKEQRTIRQAVREFDQCELQRRVVGAIICIGLEHLMHFKYKFIDHNEPY